MTKKVRVLVVDDSATMRILISNQLRQDPDIEVVGSAGDPYEAREAIKALDPDVITLDVEMPRMNGLDFLEKIMRLRPMPVVMVSTITQEGAEATLKALELGAVECIGKPTDMKAEGFAGLPDKVKAASQARIVPLGERHATSAPAADYRPSNRYVAIGSSTGGVEALVSILRGYPENCPPTVITQHMPAGFTRSLAGRLDRLSAAHISEAIDGAPLLPGMVYIAPGGGRHMEVVKSPQGLRVRLREGEAVNGHRPSVDVLFRSMAKAAGPKGVGVILTGMGRDGAQGLKEMSDTGAATIGQDEASSVVYGMPRAAFELGAVQRQLAMHKIARAILEASAAPVQEIA